MPAGVWGAEWGRTMASLPRVTGRRHTTQAAGLEAGCMPLVDHICGVAGKRSLRRFLKSRWANRAACTNAVLPRPSITYLRSPASAP